MDVKNVVFLTDVVYMFIKCLGITHARELRRNNVYMGRTILPVVLMQMHDHGSFIVLIRILNGLLYHFFSISVRIKLIDR